MYKTTDSYLGMLYAMEDYAVYAAMSPCPFSIGKLTGAVRSYGYQTNTRIKFVLAIALADAVIRDIDVRTVRVTDLPQ